MDVEKTERDEYLYLARNAQKAERYSEMFEAMRSLATLGVELTVDERNLLSDAFEQVTEPKRTSWRTLSNIKQQEVLKRDNQTVRKIEDSMEDVAKELDITCNCMISIIDDELLPSSKSEESSILYHKIAYSMAKLALDDAITEHDKPDAESYSDSFMIMQLIRDNLTLWSPDIVDEEEMVEKMKCVAKLNVELSVTERNWLSTGYKNVIDPKRASWNILSNIEHKEVVAGHQQNARKIKDLMKKVEDEISSLCSGILSIIDQHLIPSSKTVESVIFLHNM